LYQTSRSAHHYGSEGWGFESLRARSTQTLTAMQERCQLHADLVEAIAAGDADEVARLAAAHSINPGRAGAGEPA
jgi:DNA-binding GntR family transcriptional regulator